MISETQEVTQTDHSFWQVLLQVEADKLEHFFDKKHIYGFRYNYGLCHVEFHAQLHRISLIAWTAWVAGEKVARRYC